MCRVSVQPSPLRVEPKSEKQTVAKTEVDAHPKENGIAVSFASDASSEAGSSHVEYIGFANGDSRSAVSIDAPPGGTEPSSCADPEAAGNEDNKYVSNSELHSSAVEIASSNKDAPTANVSGSVVDDLQGTNAVDTDDCVPVPMDISDCESERDSPIGSKVGNKVVTADSVNACLPNCDFDSANVNNIKINGSVY